LSPKRVELATSAMEIRTKLLPQVGGYFRFKVQDFEIFM